MQTWTRKPPEFNIGVDQIDLCKPDKAGTLSRPEIS
jgi:hypothetical protein